MLKTTQGRIYCYEKNMKKKAVQINKAREAIKQAQQEVRELVASYKKNKHDWVSGCEQEVEVGKTLE